MRINLPEKVNQIIHTLQKNGFEAYAVGGCVRDSILNRTPEDWDITTSAEPEQVKKLFRRTFDTGIEHGTVTVLQGKEGFEVTTYRVDGEYKDHRRPKQVEFTRSLQEDLKRRDFTINAMAYNDIDGLVDLFGGIDDLQARVIRCVGQAVERFREDALRIMRAVRFSAQLGFAIEAKTAAAISELSADLGRISAERIQVELVKLLISPHPEKILDLYQLGITRIILPEFDPMMVTTQETPHHTFDVGRHTVRALSLSRADKILRLTMLFHDIGKPQMKTMDENGVAHFKKHAAVSEEIARRVLKRLKFDNDTLNKVTQLIRYHDYRMSADERAVRKAMNRIGTELFPLYIEVRRADTQAQSSYLQEEKLQNIKEITELFQEISAKKQCVELKDLAVTGQDLIASGIPQGPRIGAVLKVLLEEVLIDPDQNQKELLLERIKVPGFGNGQT